MQGSVKSMLHAYLPASPDFCNLGAFSAHFPENSEGNHLPKGMAAGKR